MKNALCKNDVQAVTIDSREVAEMVGRNHKEVLRDIRNYTDVLTSAKLRPLDFFIESMYKDGKGEERKCYLLTKKGCDMVANKMTGEKGIIFTAKYVTRFEEMESQIKRQVNPYAGLSQELQAIFSIDQKQQVLETRIDHLEDNLHITRSQQKQLRDFVGKVVVEALGSKQSQAYKEFGQKAFRECWKSYQNYFDIASYLDTPKKDFQKALEFINAWKPNRELQLIIIGANSQMRMQA